MVKEQKSELLPFILSALAVTTGSIMDASVKWGALGLPLFTLIWWRFALGSLIVGVPFFLKGERLGDAQAIRFHIMRGFVHATAVVTFFYGITQIPLAEATVLGFTAVLMVPFLERIALGTHIRVASIFAAVIGFVGVMVINDGTITEEASDAAFMGRVSCLISAGLYAAMLLMLRARAAKDGAWRMAVYSNIMPMAWLTPLMLYAGVLPGLDDLPILLWLACVGAGTWILATAAYARASAQSLAPLEYISLIWSALFGWLLFDEIPPASLWAGASMIVLAIALVIFADYRRARPVSGTRAPIIED